MNINLLFYTLFFLSCLSINLWEYLGYIDIVWFHAGFFLSDHFFKKCSQRQDIKTFNTLRYVPLLFLDLWRWLCVEVTIDLWWLIVATSVQMRLKPEIQSNLCHLQLAPVAHDDPIKCIGTLKELSIENPPDAVDVWKWIPPFFSREADR